MITVASGMLLAVGGIVYQVKTDQHQQPHVALLLFINVIFQKYLIMKCLH